MSATFFELGLPFPLFDAPADQASDYCGATTCSLCHSSGQHCFQLGIGADIMRDCPKCGQMNGLDADDRADSPCASCGYVILFPKVSGNEVRACYACLRSGKAAITKDTVLGMISWKEAREGVTHGIPGLKRDDFELVPKSDGWVGARLRKEMMFELLRTPSYSTIQGERWQFCCREPMVFVGTWDREEFSSRASDRDGRRLFDQIVQNIVPGLWEDELHDVTGIYVFRCRQCGRMTAHWDLA